MTEKSATWSWTESDELDGEGNPTGMILVTVPTVAYPDGYSVVMAPDATDFAKAATVQSLWYNQGRPA